MKFSGIWGQLAWRWVGYESLDMKGLLSKEISSYLTFFEVLQ